MDTFCLCVSWSGTWRPNWVKGNGRAFLPLEWVLKFSVRPLFDRYGCRVLAAVGGLGHVLMFLALAVCREYWQFLLCLGVLGGTTAAMCSTTALAAVSHWFHDRRGLAAGIAMVGSSLGGIIIPLMLQATLPRYGWTTAIRLLALVTSEFFRFFDPRKNVAGGSLRRCAASRSKSRLPEAQ